jgi:hypothetical protein
MLAAERRMILEIQIARIDVRPATVDITIWPAMLSPVTAPHADLAKLATTDMADLPTLSLSIPASVRRGGMETRLLIQGAFAARQQEPDRSLLRPLGQARQFSDMFMTSGGKTVFELSRGNRTTKTG